MAIRCYHFGFLNSNIMNSERIKQLQEQTAYPESRSVNQALLQVWNECQQENNKDIEAYKNRIRVLQNLNTKYREKLGISNEPIDALGLISPLDDVAQAE